MPWCPADKEVEQVVKLDSYKRYLYFVKKVADQQVLWSLWHADGWALAGDSLGRQLVPVWPHEKFAELCARDAWAGYVPKSLDINIWIERWIPGMQRDGRFVVVFPISGDQGAAVDPVKLGKDLQEELANYE